MSRKGGPVRSAKWSPGTAGGPSTPNRRPDPARLGPAAVYEAASAWRPRSGLGFVRPEHSVATPHRSGLAYLRRRSNVPAVGLVDRFKSWSVSEWQETRAVAADAVVRGPLWAYGQIASGKRGGRALRLFASVGARLPCNLEIWLLAFGFPAVVIAGALAITDAALHSQPVLQYAVPLAVFVVSVPVMTGLLFVASKRYQRGLTRHFGAWSLPDIVWIAAVTVTTPAVGFAALTSLLITVGLFPATVTPSGLAADLGVADWALTAKAFEMYVWSLADAIPVLKIPETLDWTSPVVLETIGGRVLVLAYKIVVLLPLAQLATGLIDSMFGKLDKSESRTDA